MALSKSSKPSKFVGGKEAIVTHLARTKAKGLKIFLEDNWQNWMENRKHVKILIICGAHGNNDGTIYLPAESNSPQQLKVSIHNWCQKRFSIQTNSFKRFKLQHFKFFCRPNGSRRKGSLKIKWRS